MKRRDDLIPESVLHALEGYVEYGLPPGDFLEAVLRDDLYDAINYADDKSLGALKHIVKAIHWGAPINCHGDAETVHRWITHKTAERMAGDQ